MMNKDSTTNRIVLTEDKHEHEFHAVLNVLYAKQNFLVIRLRDQPSPIFVTIAMLSYSEKKMYFTEVGTLNQLSALHYNENLHCYSLSNKKIITAFSCHYIAANENDCIVYETSLPEKVELRIRQHAEFALVRPTLFRVNLMANQVLDVRLIYISQGEVVLAISDCPIGFLSENKSYFMIVYNQDGHTLFSAIIRGIISLKPSMQASTNTEIYLFKFEFLSAEQTQSLELVFEYIFSDYNNHPSTLC